MSISQNSAKTISSRSTLRGVIALKKSAYSPRFTFRSRISVYSKALSFYHFRELLSRFRLLPAEHCSFFPVQKRSCFCCFQPFISKYTQILFYIFCHFKSCLVIIRQYMFLIISSFSSRIRFIHFTSWQRFSAFSVLSWLSSQFVSTSYSCRSSCSILLFSVA